MSRAADAAGPAGPAEPAEPLEIGEPLEICEPPGIGEVTEPVEPVPARGRTRGSRVARGVLVGLGSLLAVAALLGSVMREHVEGYVQSVPVLTAPLQADGSATVAGTRLALTSVTPWSAVDGPYGDTWEAPQGWVPWGVEIEVLDVPPDSLLTVHLRLRGDDGATYERPDVVPSEVAPAQGWLSGIDEVGTQQDVVLLPEGVTPVEVQVLPNWDASPYWAFPVD